MFCKIISIIVFITFCTSTVLGWSDCGSEVGSIVSLKITGCDDNHKCILVRNTNASIEIDFKSETASDAVKSVVYGIVLGVPVPFSLPNPDACVDSGVQCPISAGQQYNFHTTLPVLSTYPKVTVDVKWELQDAEGKKIVCVLIPAKIK